MRNHYCKILLATLSMSAAFSSFATSPVLILGEAATSVAKAPAKAPENGKVVINGTGQSGTFTINASNLTDRVTLTATSGLEVYPATLPADVQNATIRVTLLSTLPKTEGKIILRSGDFRAVMPVVGYGSALEQKALNANPVYTGTENKFSHALADGFTPGENGYTVEFRMKLANSMSTFDSYAVTSEGAAFKAFVEADNMGFYNGASQISISNPTTAADGGKQKFYNKDGKFHTYRFAVTSDKRIFAYRDGIQVATLRASDYGNQAEWAVENGEIVENLLKNGNFEGEYNVRPDNLVNRVEGWIVDPIDRYNCTYDVANLEIDNTFDHFNHAMKLQRYNWNDGWGAGTVSQIVDVAPNSTYSLSFLAKGGMDKKSGTNMSSVKIQELQDSKLGTSVTITNEDEMEQYGLNYTTSADCKQIKVILHNERFLNGGGWGSNPQPTYFDEMTLAGTSRVLDQKVGFNKSGAQMEYFTYDATGAYAPVTPVLSPDQNAVTIEGAGNSKTVKINIANLISADKVKVSATAGFSVYPEVLDPEKNGEIRITLLSTLPETFGKVILRSGDLRTYIDLTGYCNELEAKDLKGGAVYTGGTENKFSHALADGFTPGENGYTVEFRMKLANSMSTFDSYAVTSEGAAFKAFVEADNMGFYNGASQISISNPTTAADGGKQKFYNKDGKFHTYRFAVTSDKRIFAYRDGIQVATLRASDYGNQAEWAVENGEIVENLLKNGNFEGEYNVRPDNLVNRVEGWIVDPIDRYNCTYDVANLEIDNTFDHFNHAMKLQRYNWNDGWGAGTVSQIVDVAPNSTYSLSFLAKGGMDKKSGTNMSSVKIQELQDSKLGTSVTITNEDEMEQYGLNYTTSADCKQIKVILHNERFLNGGGWGSNPQATYVDEMTLSGTSRVLDQKVGFSKSGAQVEYFAYDVTGAYAPLAPSFGSDLDFSGVDETELANAAYTRTTADGIAFYNTPDGASVSIYDTLGTSVASADDYAAGTTLALPGHGLYIAVVTGKGQSQTFKFVY